MAVSHFTKRDLNSRSLLHAHCLSSDRMHGAGGRRAGGWGRVRARSTQGLSSGCLSGFGWGTRDWEMVPEEREGSPGEQVLPGIGVHPDPRGGVGIPGGSGEGGLSPRGWEVTPRGSQGGPQHPGLTSHSREKRWSRPPPHAWSGVATLQSSSSRECWSRDRPRSGTGRAGSHTQGRGPGTRVGEGSDRVAESLSGLSEGARVNKLLLINFY
jgi:hypothetical protein